MVMCVNAVYGTYMCDLLRCVFYWCVKFFFVDSARSLPWFGCCDAGLQISEYLTSKRPNQRWACWTKMKRRIWRRSPLAVRICERGEMRGFLGALAASKDAASLGLEVRRENLKTACARPRRSWSERCFYFLMLRCVACVYLSRTGSVAAPCQRRRCGRRWRSIFCEFVHLLFRLGLIRILIR